MGVYHIAMFVAKFCKGSVKDLVSYFPFPLLDFLEIGKTDGIGHIVAYIRFLVPVG
jgi:hypothetical protein